MLIYFAYKYIKNKKVRVAVCIILSLLIPLIGFSRIYLGVHYTSDVLAGFLISIAYLIIFTSIAPKLLKLEK
ncbi:MAG: phosphatase PAP2 family protein [Clostridia bacterium]|nr:phosphatase PAP2 family protein [Clostridia bacterium]